MQNKTHLRDKDQELTTLYKTNKIYRTKNIITKDRYNRKDYGNTNM